MKRYFLKNQNWTIPAALSLIIYIPLLIWLRQDNSLPHWDMGRHLYNSVQYGRLWTDFVAGRDSFWHLLTAYFYYPPLFYQAGVIFYVIFGVTQKVAVASNLVWIFILIYSLYHLTRQIWGKRLAILAVAILFSMPMIIGASREYQLDLPLTAWVSLTYLLFFQYQKKPEFRKAIWLGIIIGLGMLLKWTFLVFALPIALWTLINVIIAKRAKPKKIFLSALAVIVTGLLFAGSWYVVNRTSIHADFIANGIEAAKREGDPVGFSYLAIIYYLKVLGIYYLLLPLGLASVLGLIFSFFSKERLLKNLFPVLMVILPYLIFTLVPNKDPRYIMPVAPFLAIIAASLIDFVRVKKLQAVLVALILLIFMVNNICVAFNASGGHDVKLGENLIILRGSGYTSSAPRQEFCPIESIVQSVPAEASARLVGNNPIEFNNWALAYYLEKDGRRWAGESQNTMDSDYWIIRLDGSASSKEILFQYQDMARIVDNFSCIDRSLVIVMKNATRANTYLPTY